MLLDVLSLELSAVLGMALLQAVGLAPTEKTALAVLAFAPPSFVIPFMLGGLYRRSRLRAVPSGITVLSGVARALPMAGMLLLVSLVLSRLSTGLRGVEVVAAVALPALAVVPIQRLSWHRVAIGRPSRVIILGSGEVADAVKSRLERNGGVDILGTVDDEPRPGFPTIGKIEELETLCREKGVDVVIVALPQAPWLVVSQTLFQLIGGVDILVVPSFFELITWRSGVIDVGGIPLVPLREAQRSSLQTLKRAFDLVAASLLLVLSSPLALAAAISIRCTSPGPVFFRQVRSGRGGKAFTIFKFRTMYAGAEEQRADLVTLSDADGPRFKMTRDPRVTRVGAVLRRFSIDELPQLLNVLSGQMSLVGPRPFPLDEAEALHMGSAAARFDVLPGMTGLWQVSGRSDLSWDDLCRLDAIYVRSWSLWWDVRILLQTPWAVIRRQGAY